MTLFKRVFVLQLLFLLYACEMKKEIDYEPLTYQPQIIVHGYISTADGVELILKKTRPVNSTNDNDTIIGAKVCLYNEKQDSIYLSTTDQYHYKCDSLGFVKEGTQYYIKVNVDGFKELITAKQTILKPPTIDSVTMNDDFINIHFNNDYSENEYFQAQCYRYYDGEMERRFNEKFGMFVVENIKLGVNTIECQNDSYHRDSILVELYVLSNDLMQFLTSLDAYDYTIDDPFFPQPYTVYTNISGGYGIFAAHNYTSLVIHTDQK